jgi:hypothetical protein
MMRDQTKTRVSPCGGLEENLVLFHYGELDGIARGELQEHVQGCSACADYLRELGELLPLTLKADQPPETFWTDYSRELRQKFDLAAEPKSWIQVIRDFLQPRWIPALASAVVVALALTFTLGRGIWEPAHDDAAIMEVLPVAENLEFFKAMEVLDNLDLLESMGSQSNAT